MRAHRIIFLSSRRRCVLLAWLAGALLCTTGCPASKKDIESAKHSLYDTEFAVLYAAALEATRETYPNLEDVPGRGAIKTAWHQVSYANNQDDLSNPRTVAAGQGLSNSTPQVTSNQAAAGMPTRLAYKRFFIRFDVTIAGGRPWRLKVIGHAAEWEPGAAMPSELHGVARPSWLDGRTDALLFAIYKRIKPYAVPMPEQTDSAEETKRTDPAAFKDVPPAVAKRLAALKDVLAARDYAALRGYLADDVVWSLGGGTGADVAMATWQADPEPLDAMAKAIAAGCAGDAKKVSCPAGAPARGAYQLVFELRQDSWFITSFVKGE